MIRKLYFVGLIALLSGCGPEKYRFTVEYENCNTGKIDTLVCDGVDVSISNDGVAVPALRVHKFSGTSKELALNVCDFKIIKKEEIKR